MCWRIQEDCVVVVDEAYADFCDVTAIDLLAQHDNLVVTRTFSKWSQSYLKIPFEFMTERSNPHHPVKQACVCTVSIIFTLCVVFMMVMMCMCVCVCVCS